jgi:dolichol-phosphate mannosyltransferase
MTNKMISVVVPCYNEEAVILETYNHLKKVMKENNFESYELIFINDGSKDRTFSILLDTASQDSTVKLISFSRNFGHEPAVTAGLDYTTGDLIFIIDADLQDPPELFPTMIDLYNKESADIVYGVRKERKGESFLKKFTAKTFYRTLNYLSDVNLPKDAGNFRLMNKRIVLEYRKLHEKNKYARGLISWIGFKQVPFAYERQPRFSGSSKYNYSRMVHLASTAIFYFSKKPLLLAINLGFFCVLASIIFSIYVFWGKMTSSLPGWASTLLIIIFFGGIQLLTIGILGIYMGNIFDEVKNRPEYIIDRTINIEI